MTTYKNRLQGVTVTAVDGLLELRAPYNSKSICKYHKLRGRWDKEEKVWLFPAGALDGLLRWYGGEDDFVIAA